MLACRRSEFFSGFKKKRLRRGRSSQIAVALLGLGKVRAHLGGAGRGPWSFDGSPRNLLAAMRLPQAEEAKAELAAISVDEPI